MVENLVHFRGIQIRDDLSTAPRQVSGRPALFRIGCESFLAGARKNRAARFGGDGILRGHGRRAGCEIVWTPWRRTQHGAGGRARARTFAKGGRDELGTGGCGPWSRPVQLLRRYLVGSGAGLAIFYGHSRRKQERRDPAAAARDSRGPIGAARGTLLFGDQPSQLRSAV